MLEYFRKLWANQIRAAWVLVPLIFIALLILWPSTPGIALLAVVLLIIFWVALKTGDEGFRHSFESLAALMSCIALMLAGYWYFVERRGIPKLNATSAIQAWPIGNNQAFVRVELRLENVGSSAITFDEDDPFRLEIGQVLPAVGKDVAELRSEYHELVAGAEPMMIKATDRWPTRARVKGGLDFTIESGETERRYFKAIVPCELGLVLTARADIPKQLNWFQTFLEADKRQLFWRGQSLSEPIKQC